MSTRRTGLTLGCLAALSLATTPVLAASNEVVVNVAEVATCTFHVTGQFTVSADDNCVWKVLTDYDQLGKFLPGMHSSIVKRSSANAMLVQQDSTTWFMGIPKKNHVILKVEEDPLKRIDFADVALKDFESYRGSWLLARNAGMVRVDYEATTKPRFVPPLCGKAVVQDTVRNMLRDLREEMLRRQSGTR